MMFNFRLSGVLQFMAIRDQLSPGQRHCHIATRDLLSPGMIIVTAGEYTEFLEIQPRTAGSSGKYATPGVRPDVRGEPQVIKPHRLVIEPEME